MSNQKKIKNEDINPNRQLTCRYIGCFEKIKLDKLMCKRHWQLVPTEMQNKIYSAFSKFKSIIKVAHASTEDIQTAINNLNRVQNEAIDFVSRPGVRTRYNISDKDMSMVEQAKVYLNNQVADTLAPERIVFADSGLPPSIKSPEILQLETALINLENDKLPENYTLEVVASELNKKMPPTMEIKVATWQGRSILRAYIKDMPVTDNPATSNEVTNEVAVPAQPVQVTVPTTTKSTIVDETGLPKFPLTVKKLDSMKLIDETNKDDNAEYTEIYRG